MNHKNHSFYHIFDQIDHLWRQKQPLFSKTGSRRPEARDDPAWAASPAGADVSPRRSKATDHDSIHKENGTESHRISPNHNENSNEPPRIPTNHREFQRTDKNHTITPIFHHDLNTISCREPVFVDMNHKNHSL